MAIERAVEVSLGSNMRTKDIFEPGKILVGTKEMAEEICLNLQ